MRKKITEFEDCNPLLAVRDGMILAKNGDLTLGWEITLPVACTISEAEYDDFILSLASAIRLLPPWSIVHKQDSFYEQCWQPGGWSTASYLKERYNSFFEGKSYLEHHSYLYLTLSKQETIRKRSYASVLFRHYGEDELPPLSNVDRVAELQRVSSMFISAIRPTQGMSIRPLTDRDLRGDEEYEGIIFRYEMLGLTGSVITDVELTPDSIKACGKTLSVYTVTDTSALPSELTSVIPEDRYCADGAGLMTSLGYQIGMSLRCEHVLNQYFVLIPQLQQTKEAESRGKRMRKFKTGSRNNEIYSAALDEFSDEAITGNLTVCLTHMDLMVIGEDGEQFSRSNNEAVSKLLSMRVEAARNTSDAPCLYLSGIPGAAGELGMEEFVKMELESSLCLGCYETFDDGLPAGNITLCDRERLIPIKLDLGDTAMSLGYITNYNMVIVGNSGAGKSFTCNDLLSQLYHSGYEIVLMDKGDSYEGLCAMISYESGNKDGQYYSYDKEHPFSFNPFDGLMDKSSQTDSGDDIDTDMTLLMAILQCIWTPQTGWTSAVTGIIEQTIGEFIQIYCPSLKLDTPTFGDYVQFMTGVVLPAFKEGSYKAGGAELSQDNINMVDYCLSLQPYGFGGKWATLLNGKSSPDIMSSRFTVFEIDKVSGIPEVYPIWILCIMKSFEKKMRTSTGKKMLVIEEAWQAIKSEATSSYLEWLWRTARKFSTSAVLITQQAEDLASNESMRKAILHNSDTKIILDPGSEKNTFAEVSQMLGLSKGQHDLVLSLNTSRNPQYRYREIFMSIGRKCGVYSVLVSPEQALLFESDKGKKKALMDLIKSGNTPIQAIQTLLSNHPQ